MGVRSRQVTRRYDSNQWGWDRLLDQIEQRARGAAFAGVRDHLTDQWIVPVDLVERLSMLYTMDPQECPAIAKLTLQPPPPMTVDRRCAAPCGARDALEILAQRRWWPAHAIS